MKKWSDANRASIVRWIYAAVITLVCLALVIMLGPMNFFRHGYYCDDEVSMDVATPYISRFLDLGAEDYYGKFRPTKPHFVGIEVYLANQPQGNTGTLYAEVLDEAGKVVDVMSTDLSSALQDIWWDLYANKELSVDRVYSLHIYAEGCSTYPQLRVVDEALAPDELAEGPLLLGFAYAKPTFTPTERVLLIILVCALYLSLLSFAIPNAKGKRAVAGAGVFWLLVTVMSWQFLFNTFNAKNTGFPGFQTDSEAYVSGTFLADKDGVWTGGSYGLGIYCNINGTMSSYTSPTYVTDGNWRDGYHRVQAEICIYPNNYTRSMAVAGNKVKFSNGEVFDITNVEINDWYVNIFLNSPEPLTPERCGSLSDITFCDPEGAELPRGFVTQYHSQYGLQGKMFRPIARLFEGEQALRCLYLICSIALAVVFMLIVVMVKEKYNLLMAGCFYVTFLLSPWIVNFARNLYWVEFTWFLPMAVGLLCAWKLESRGCRIFCYIAAAITICVKSLCGYEYISVIMMGLIAFLLVDLVMALCQKDRRKAVLTFRTTVIIGVCALIGFFAAICLHAVYTGDGDIAAGIKKIIENTVLRRTSDADLNHYFYDSYLTESLNASVWEVLKRYFHFSTEIVAGIDGGLFPLLCLAPLVIFAFDYRKKQLDLQNVSFYIVFFLATVSWYVLAKGHSYIHPHMNYVLWYFGFVQICFYIIIRKVARGIKRNTEHGESEP